MTKKKNSLLFTHKLSYQNIKKTLLFSKPLFMSTVLFQ